MSSRIVALSLALLLVSSSCSYIQPPADVMENEARIGALGGCVAALIALVGVPSPIDRERYVALCEPLVESVMAARREALDRMGLEYFPPPQPQDSLQHFAPPDGTL